MVGDSEEDPMRAPAMPSWLSWWPGPFGRSWVFESLNLGSGVA